jgi:predicted DNA-binding transcriptional regulator AlpA
MTQSILLDARQTAAFLGISLRSLRDLAMTEGFPPARAPGARSTRWVRPELEAYAAALPAITKPEPPQLTADRAAKVAGLPVAPAPFGQGQR